MEECTSTDPEDELMATRARREFLVVRTSWPMERKHVALLACWMNRALPRGAGVKRKLQEKTTNFLESAATRIPRNNQLFLQRCVHEGVPQLRHMIVPLHPISYAMRVSMHILSKGSGGKARTKLCENLGECTSTDPKDELMAAEARRELLVVWTSWSNGEKTRSAAGVLDDRALLRGAGVKRKSQEETANFWESVATRILRHN
ncbi:hypothetical protein Scep_017321 [Stephania cephalantha]|uniref:Uncharacterized protein n=1 Tax=Stephania cephalantha TaxID=152367 RepID=A0AAP0NU51_9MAGN